MSFKTTLLRHYLWWERIIYVISHDPLSYVWLILLYGILIAGVFFGYKYTVAFVTFPYMNWIFATVGLIIYIRFIIKFMDIYLDSIVLTDRGLIIFMWGGLLKYTSESVQRHSIESVYDQQNGILDVVFNKGDLTIKRQGENYIFKDVSHPKIQADEILKVKDKMLVWLEDDEPVPDKFDVLVETLGEVILDYVKKGKSTKHLPPTNPENDNENVL